MCHRSFYEYERRSGADATWSLLQALRDLFRRTRRPQAQEVEMPEVQAEVIPLRAEAGARGPDAPVRERADAA